MDTSPTPSLLDLRVIRACQHLHDRPSEHDLTELAEKVGLSPGHLHRLFRQELGLTPRQYAEARRAEAVRTRLEQMPCNGRILDAALDAGFETPSRFYAASGAILGMTPVVYRQGGVNTTLSFATGPCSLGHILVAETVDGIAAILMGDEPEPLVEDLQRRFPKAHLVGGDSAFDERVARVVGFLENPGLPWDLPLDVRGTLFQARVWQALRRIPLGATVTYSELAAAIGQPQAARAVASACAANPLAWAIPCHRVVRGNGEMGGYRWGVARKAVLLARERQLVSEGPPLPQHA